MQFSWIILELKSMLAGLAKQRISYSYPCFKFSSLTATERVCLISLDLRNLFATLKLLAQRIHIGVYDFCHLPLALKKQINDSDEIIERIHSTFTGTGIIIHILSLVHGIF